jgi:GT2 family glycosyltransferase
VVQVFIPTSGRETLREALEALRRQTFRGFEVVLIAKGGLKASRADRVIVQREGLYEEALNLALAALNPDDVALFTDDDAVPSSTWVEEHLEFHERNPDAAIASGSIEGRKWKNYPNALFRRFKGTKYMEPYDSRFEGYTAFVTKTGLSVDGEAAGTAEVERSVAIGGVNMSLKTNYFLGFQVPTYSLRGSHNETVLALRGMALGGHSMRFRGASVRHLGSESLSRTEDPLLDKYLCLEKHAFPFAVNMLLKLDLDLLEDLAARLEDGVPKLGLATAIRGIREGLSPLEFRKRLEDIYLKREEVLGALECPQ